MAAPGAAAQTSDLAGRNIGVSAAGHAPKAAPRTVTTRSRASWAVLVALCIAGVALGISGGLVYRRR